MSDKPSDRSSDRSLEKAAVPTEVELLVVDPHGPRRRLTVRRVALDSAVLATVVRLPVPAAVAPAHSEIRRLATEMAGELAAPEPAPAAAAAPSAAAPE